MIDEMDDDNLSSDQDSIEPMVGSAPAVAPRRVSIPQSQFSRSKTFGNLFLVLIVLMPVMFIGLQLPQVTEYREAESLAIARQTWQRQQTHEVPYDWIIPVYNGMPKIDPPPMSAWINMCAWIGLDASTATSEQLIYRSRLLSIFFGMLTLMGTFWAGMSIGDVRVARLATLALGSTLLFVYQVRMASSDTHMLAFTTLAIAAGFWAMRPLKEINWVGRRVFGWVLAGLALGAAVLTQGVNPAALYVLPPLLAAILLTPRRRLDNTIGMTFAAILGLVVAAPWYLYVVGHEPNAKILGDIVPEMQEWIALSPTHLRILIVLSPWAVWLIGALFQPFIRADHDRRRQLLIAWAWFLLLFAILTIPAAQSPRYLTPLLPAAALLVGQLWAFHAQLASERQVDPGVDLLRVPHWVVLGGASVIGPLLILLQPWLLEKQYIGELFLPGMVWWHVAALCGALVLITMLGVRWHAKWKPRLAAYATVGWMLAVLAVTLPSYARANDSRFHYLKEAKALADRSINHRILRLEGGPELGTTFLFYTGRSIATITDDQLAEAMDSYQRTILLVPRHRGRDGPFVEQMRELGLEASWSFDDGEQPYFFMEKSGTEVATSPQ